VIGCATDVSAKISLAATQVNIAGTTADSAQLPVLVDDCPTPWQDIHATIFATAAVRLRGRSFRPIRQTESLGIRGPGFVSVPQGALRPGEEDSPQQRCPELSPDSANGLDGTSAEFHSKQFQERQLQASRRGTRARPASKQRMSQRMQIAGLPSSSCERKGPDAFVVDRKTS